MLKLISNQCRYAYNKKSTEWNVENKDCALWVLQWLINEKSFYLCQQ